MHEPPHIVVVEEVDEAHPRVRMIVRRDRVIVIFDLFRVARCGREHTTDFAIERKIQHRVVGVSAPRLGPGKSSVARLGGVEHLAELNEIGLAHRRGERADFGIKKRPEINLHMLHRVETESVEVGQFDPKLKDFHQVGAHAQRLGFQIVESI